MNTDEDELRAKQAAFWLEYGHTLATSIRYSEALRAIERSLSLNDSKRGGVVRKGNVPCDASPE